MLTNKFPPRALLVLSQCLFFAQSAGAVSQSPAVLPYFFVQAEQSKQAIFIPSLNYKCHTRFAYDAKTLRYQVPPTSIFILRQASLVMPDLLEEPHVNFDGSKQLNAGPKQKTIQDHKQGFNAMRLSRGLESISLYALISGQSSPKSLAVPDKTEPDDIAASPSPSYVEGKANVDQGYVLNLEARVDLPEFFERLPVLTQFIVFVDTSAITVNPYNWADRLNHTTLSGAGVGLNWAWEDDFEVKVYVAQKLGNEVLASAPDLARRFWIQAVKYF